MGRSLSGWLINYIKKKIKGVKRPRVFFTTPDAVDIVPEIDMQFAENIVIQCPKCRTRATVPHYTFDYTCTSGGDGCSANQVKYYDRTTEAYVTKNLPFDFDVRRINNP